MVKRMIKYTAKAVFWGWIAAYLLFCPCECHSEVISTLADNSTEKTITLTGLGQEICYIEIPLGSIVNDGYVHITGDFVTTLTSEISHYLDIGDDNTIEWRHWGEFLTKEVSPDLSKAIEVYLFGHPGSDGNVQVPLTFYTQSESGGNLKISNIHIDVSPGHTEQISLKPGFNMFVCPIQGIEGFNASHLLSGYLSPDKAASIWAYDSEKGRYQVIYRHNGQIRGDAFDIQDTRSYLIYMHEADQITFVGRVKEFPDLEDLNLKNGLNLIDLCPPTEGYTSYDLLKDLGPDVLSVSVYDKNQALKTTYWTFQKPAGDSFLIQPGIGYLVYQKQKD